MLRVVWDASDRTRETSDSATTCTGLTRGGVDGVSQVVELDVDGRSLRLVRQRLHLDTGRDPGDRSVFGHAEHAGAGRLDQYRRVFFVLAVLFAGGAVDSAERHGALHPADRGGSVFGRHVRVRFFGAFRCLVSFEHTNKRRSVRASAVVVWSVNSRREVAHAAASTHESAASRFGRTNELVVRRRRRGGSRSSSRSSRRRRQRRRARARSIVSTSVRGDTLSAPPSSSFFFFTAVYCGR